jgi:hypothetical protein
VSSRHLLIVLFFREFPSPISSSPSADERILRERRPNNANKEELLLLMDRTRDERRAWITRDEPSITEILNKYPRFVDIPDAVSHFHSTKTDDCLKF